MSQRAYRHDLRCPLRFQLDAQVRPFPGQTDLALWRLQTPLHPGGQPPLLPEQVKSQAARMYLEGSSISAIGRVLGVRLETVYSWIQKKPQRLGRP